MATEFGKILKIIRINSGDGTKEMADKFGVSVPYLYAIENGRRDIPDDIIEKVIANYPLNESDIAKLKEAVLTTKDRMKIDLSTYADKRKRLIVTLVNEDIDDVTLDEIIDIVNKRKGK